MTNKGFTELRVVLLSMSLAQIPLVLSNYLETTPWHLAIIDGLHRLLDRDVSRYTALCFVRLRLFQNGDSAVDIANWPTM